MNWFQVRNLINKKKFGTWFGKCRGRQDQPFGLNWSTEVKKLYGVHLGSEDSENTNWTKVLSKLLEDCSFL